MSIIVGIDEAGYGPTLGPLVVTATIFDSPGVKECDLWELLNDIVSKKSSKNRESIVVNDSKKLYSRSKGFGVLEESVLAFLFNLKDIRKSFKELITDFSDLKDNDFNIYPWYCNKDVLIPVDSKMENILKLSDALRLCLKNSGVKIVDVKSIPVCVHKYNCGIEKFGKKSDFLFDTCASLLLDIWKRFGEKSPAVYVDKHGGRNIYLHLLYPHFEGNFLKTHKESATESIYEVTSDTKNMFVHFVKGSETKHLPNALASMCSKYFRENFLRMFNSYWQENVENLKATAGYYVDAIRFLDDIDKVRKNLEIKDEILIRLK